MAKTEKTGSIMGEGYNYDTLRVRDKEGKLHYVRGNHDALTKALALHMIVNGKDIMTVAKANKLELAEYTNPGQLRMAVGNKLRAILNRGEPVVVGTITLKSLNDRVDLPTEEAGEAPAKAAKPVAKKAAAPTKAAKAAKPAKGGGKLKRKGENAAAA